MSRLGRLFETSEARARRKREERFKKGRRHDDITRELEGKLTKIREELRELEASLRSVSLQDRAQFTFNVKKKAVAQYSQGQYEKLLLLLQQQKTDADILRITQQVEKSMIDIATRWEQNQTSISTGDLQAALVTLNGKDDVQADRTTLLQNHYDNRMQGMSHDSAAVDAKNPDMCAHDTICMDAIDREFNTIPLPLWLVLTTSMISSGGICKSPHAPKGDL